MNTGESAQTNQPELEWGNKRLISSILADFQRQFEFHSETLVWRIFRVWMDLHCPTLSSFIPWLSILRHNPFMPASVTAVHFSTFKYLGNKDLISTDKLYCMARIVDTYFSWLQNCPRTWRQLSPAFEFGIFSSCKFWNMGRKIWNVDEETS